MCQSVVQQQQQGQQVTNTSQDAAVFVIRLPAVQIMDSNMQQEQEQRMTETCDRNMYAVT